MVLEALMTIRDAVRSPWHMVLFGAIISLISLGVSYLIFPENAGLLTVFLITIISAPFMIKLLEYEERKEERKVSKISFVDRINPLAAFSRQREIFIIYSAFFAGSVIALSLAFLFMPEEFVAKVFNDQLTQIEKLSSLTGSFTAPSFFTTILVNNLVVMGISFVFALLFGIGAIFILAWNASVLSALIGIVAKASGVPTAIAPFLLYGVFEIAAYFVAGIAGGIISVAVSKRGTRSFGRVVEDMVVMMVFSIVLIFIAAFIESAVL